MTRHLRPILLAALAAALAPAVGAQNLVVNGDFESLTASGCMLNLTNADFDATVANAMAFGSADEIDVFDDPAGCGHGSAPISGTSKVSIHTTHVSGKIDAFSLELTAAVVAGGVYTLSFHVEPDFTFDPDLGEVQVGLSNDPLSFGTQIFAGTGNPAGGWTRLTHTFTAPVAGAFLTVRNDIRKKSWNHLDNFCLGLGAGACGNCTVRNGSGINPVEFRCTTAPALGTVWVTDIVTNANTVNTFLGLAASQHPGLPLFGGELLLGLTPPPVFLTGTGTHTLQLPMTPSLHGVVLFTQGLRIDDPGQAPVLVLLNGLDVRLTL